MEYGHGLSEKHLQIIKNILTKNSSTIEKAALFGSRATNSYKSNSDIDLVLYGNLKEKTADNLWTCFFESFLPYKVDLNVYDQIKSTPLKKHIDNHSKVLFTKKQLYQNKQKIK